MLKIGIASSETEKAQISHLRTEAYKIAFGTSLKSFSFLNWDKNDDRGLVMYLSDEKGEAIASLRAIMLHSKEELEALFDITLPGSLACPLLAMDRLVIAPSHRKKGLSGLFRHYLYGACVGTGIRNLTFTINDGSSRIPFQQKMGFKFEEADISHRIDNPYDNKGGILLARLTPDSFDQAYRVGSEHLIVDLDGVLVDDDFLPELHAYLQLADPDLDPDR